MISPYLSVSKVINFQSEVIKLYKYSKKNFELLRNCESELKEIKKRYIELEKEFIEKSIQKIEKTILDNKIYSELKNKIEDIMEIETEEDFVSVILSQILNEDYGFDDEKCMDLIDIVMNILKDIGNPETADLPSEAAADTLRDILVDFLCRFRDKYPFSNQDEENTIGTFDIITDFMSEYDLKPSKSLIKEYSQSEVTKKLNLLPSIEHLNEMFKNGHKIIENDYDRLKKRLNDINSQFTFYFNPSIEPMENVSEEGGLYMIGFFEKETKKRIGAGITIHSSGSMYQGYYKDDHRHHFGRVIFESGDIYEGGYKMNYWHGNGKYLYGNGKKEIGYWEEGCKQGIFE